jgi:hypothetical protein
MTRIHQLISICSIAVAIAACSYAFGPSRSTDSSAEPPSDMPPQLPPGWTMDDVAKAMAAGAPGDMHQFLTESVGRWRGTSMMWVAPGIDPAQGEGVSTVTSVMGGRFITVEHTADWPGIGPYNGLGLFGYDNVTGQFQSVWIEDHSTGMSIGTGTLSPDGRTLTWTLTYSCPLRGRPVQARQIERVIDADTRVLELHSTCPKTDQEFKMMEIRFTRKSAAPGE